MMNQTAEAFPTCVLCGYRHGPDQSHALCPADDSTCQINGNEVDESAALNAVAEVVGNADSLLITGLQWLDWDSQCRAIALADRLQAIVDVSTAGSQRGSALAFHERGDVSATFGEIEQRADVIVSWYCDPVSTHRCRWERLWNESKSRTLIAVDETNTKTSQQADVAIVLPRKEAPLLINALRMLAMGLNLDELNLNPSGLAVKTIQSLWDTLRSAKYGAIISGPANHQAAIDPEADTLSQLAISLNDHARFALSHWSASFNEKGAAANLASLTGFPAAVNLHQGYPRYRYTEYATERLLQRQAIDALLIATGPGDHDRLQPYANLLTRIPVVELATHADQQPLESADIVIPISVRGDVMREDGVVLSLNRPNGESIEANDVFGSLLAGQSG